MAAHEKVIHKWDKVGELALATVLVAIVIFAPEAGAMIAEWFGGDAAAAGAAEGTTDAAVTASSDTATDSAANKVSDANNTVSNADTASGSISDSGKGDRYSSSGSALKEAVISTLFIDQTINVITNEIFGFTVTPASNSDSVEQLSNREINYGNMNGIYTVPSNNLNTIDTVHSGWFLENNNSDKFK